MKHFWFGEILTGDIQLQDKLEVIWQELSSQLAKRLDVNHLVSVSNKFSENLLNKDSSYTQILNSLLEDGFSSEESEELINEIARFCSKENLKLKLKRELGSEDIQDLKRVDFKRDIFESWEPLGVLTHITPGNSPGLSFLALMEGLLAGNINLIKLSSKDSNLTIKIIQELIKFDQKDIIENFVAIVKISSSNKTALESIISYSDGVSVWGGDGAIQGIREMLPPGVRFIPWGHKISLALITEKSLEDEGMIQKLAEDCVAIDQQACSSPQTLFVETEDREKIDQFSQKLLKAMSKIKHSMKETALTIQEQAEITNISEVVRLEEVLGKSRLFEDHNKSCRVFVDYSSGISTSPLYGSIWVRPLKKEQVLRTLFPMRQYLQTCGLACQKDESGTWIPLLIKAGVLRVTNPGEMLESYDGEPHDGVYSLTRMMKRVRAEHHTLKEQYRLSSLQPDLNDNREIPNVPIMGKEDFQKQTPKEEKTKLYFRSGGSSGAPALSTFSYDDYHTQMQASAEGLYAAGLNPDEDRVMNLFFGGGLYGGFLSFHTILEKLQAVHFPMQAIEDYPSVASTIVSNSVDTLIGMPSYLLGLFKFQKEQLKEYGKIKKIFFGGEHLLPKQRDWLKNEFGVEVIKAASYGSVDAGPLGFQCSHLEGSEYHLNHTLHSLEVISLEKDTPVDMGSIGRLVFTSHKRDSLKIERYDVGDLGRIIPGNCKCGRRTLKFELLGRTGDVFRASGTFFNFQKFTKILNENLNYSGELQLVVEKTQDGINDHLILNLEGAFNEDEFTQELLDQYKDLKEAVIKEKCLKFSINQVNTENFYRVKSSGKLKRVVDLR